MDIKKPCIYCNKNKPFTSFERSSLAIDRYTDYCRDCKYKNNRWQHYKGDRIREENRLPDNNKWCACCNLIKPLDAFLVQRNTPSGRHSSCKECTKEKLIKRKTKIGNSSEQ